MHNPNKLVLNYKKRTNMYTNSTGSCTFDPAKIEARSYKWWVFVAVVESKVIFNNYSYSVSTSKHQYRIRQLLQQLNIKIDINMPLKKGINSTNLQDLIVESEEQICDKFLSDVLKAQDRYQRQKEKRLANRALQAEKFNKKVETLINKEERV